MKKQELAMDCCLSVIDKALNSLPAGEMRIQLSKLVQRAQMKDLSCHYRPRNGVVHCFILPGEIQHLAVQEDSRGCYYSTAKGMIQRTEKKHKEIS